MQKPHQCFEPTPCPLANTSNGFSMPEGTGALGVAIIGEALGDNEYKDGQPFRPYAEAGSCLQSAIRIAQHDLQRAAVQRDGFLLWNLVACNPAYNKLSGQSFEAEAVQHCSVYFNYVLNGFVERNPNRRCLLACGGLPLKYLTGASGSRQNVSDLRGYVLQSQWGWVVPTYHPSYVRRGNLQLMPCLVADLKRALAVAEGSYNAFANGPEWEEPRYLIAPNSDTAWSFYHYVASNSGLVLSVDIETSGSRFFDEDTYTEGEVEGQLGEEIELVQFSFEKRSGIALKPKFHEDVIKALLETPNVKVGHNWWLFDAPRIKQRGWKVNGPVHDTMWMFRKYRPELPSGLQAVAGWAGFPFPWKHLFDKELEWYGCLTGETRIVLADGSKRKIRDIVNKKENVLVRSSFAGSIDNSQRIVGWRKIKVKGQRWLKIKVDATDQPIYCTPDHRIMVQTSTDRIWKSAEQIQSGDIVLIGRSGQAALIHGSLLGDGTLDKRGRLKIVHSLAQQDWFEKKRQALSGPLYHVKSTHKQTPQVATEVWVSPRIWRTKCYNPDGTRFFFPPSNAALAVWYCDDGTYANSGSEHRTGNPRLCLSKFSNLGTLRDWFEKEFGKEDISTYVDSRIDTEFSTIAIKGDARYKFFDRISQWIPPCMDYKLPEFCRGRYNGWLDHKEAQCSVVLSIEPYTPKREAETRYCITVENNHNFFTLGGLVENCADVDSPHWIMEWLIPMMQKTGTWKHYFDHVFRYRIEVLNPAEDRGIPVDETERLALKERLEARREEEDKALQEAIPPEVRQVKPRRKVKYLDEQTGEEKYVVSFGYLKPPKPLLEAEKDYNLLPEEDKTGFANFVYEKLGLVKREVEDINFGCTVVELKGGKTKEKPIKPKKGDLLPGRGYREKRWCQVTPFKASKQQMSNYIRWKRKQLEQEEANAPRTNQSTNLAAIEGYGASSQRVSG